ncbi:hypothetical protein ACFIQF_19445 [Comamonas sp. J-3]|uniref:hypothetical protein n=1 Tax=Comamonas trifloxystrobinivorans TaxID=3350256 RepID=UPI00372B038E
MANTHHTKRLYYLRHCTRLHLSVRHTDNHLQPNMAAMSINYQSLNAAYTSQEAAAELERVRGALLAFRAQYGLELMRGDSLLVKRFLELQQRYDAAQARVYAEGLANAPQIPEFLKRQAG